MLPTSGELAFLAGLPVPTVRPDDDVHDGDNKGKEKEASTFNARDSPAGARSHFLDDPVSGSAISPSSLPGPTEILAASSRRWTGNFDGSVVHRRDTWVVGEKWGRHVRVIDVGSRGTPGPGNRKSSE